MEENTHKPRVKNAKACLPAGCCSRLIAKQHKLKEARKVKNCNVCAKTKFFICLCVCPQRAREVARCWVVTDHRAIFGPASRDFITTRESKKIPFLLKEEGFSARQPAKPPGTPRSRGRANELMGVCRERGAAKAEAVQQFQKGTRMLHPRTICTSAATSSPL